MTTDAEQLMIDSGSQITISNQESSRVHSYLQDQRCPSLGSGRL